MLVGNLINKATKELISSKINNPILDSEILLSKILNQDRKYTILNPKENLGQRNKDRFYELVDRRKKGEPIAYILEKKDFWKETFYINKHVLIPRPDTELIIEEVLKLYPNRSRMHVLDIGTGSGCILLSLLNELKDSYGTGIDISKESIKVSKYNSRVLQLNNRANFYVSDVDKFIQGKYDIIVSNPPYIQSHRLKYLDRDVKNFEPKLALDGGVDGLLKTVKVINKSLQLLKNNGKLVLEIGFNQKMEILKILKKKRFYINKVSKDYANNYRCIVCTKI